MLEKITLFTRKQTPQAYGRGRNRNHLRSFRDMALPLTIQGRGTPVNPANRFDPIDFDIDGDFLDLPEEERPSPVTQFSPRYQPHDHRDQRPARTSGSPTASTRTAAASTAAFTASRGPVHEYLGFSAGLDFETKIMVKEIAPELLRAELSEPQVDAAYALDVRRDGLLSTVREAVQAHAAVS